MAQRVSRVAMVSSAFLNHAATLVALLAGTVLTISEAHANCVLVGAVVTCTGVTTNQNPPNGFTNLTGGLTVNVVGAGSSVTGNAIALSLGSNVTVTNDVGATIGTNGTITSGTGIGASGSLNNITNNGTIVAIGTGVIAFGAVTNTGSITGATAVSATGGGGSLTLGNSAIGTINAAPSTGSGAAITYGGSGSAIITNSGTIQVTNGVGSAIAASNTTLTNNAGALISGALNGVSVTGGAGLASITNAGTIQAATGAIFTLGGSVTNQATGVITGSGGTALLFNGTNASTFTNRGTVNGGATMSNGNDTIALETGSSMTGAIDGRGGTDALQLNAGAAATGTLSSSFSNVEALTVNAAGQTWIFTGTGTPSGGTTISAGTLQLGNGGTSGTLGGDVVNNANFALNRSDDLTFGGAISGTGSVAQLGPGTTTLSGANSYSGGTAINAGAIAISSDGNLGDAAGGVTFGGGTLQLLGSIDLAGSRAIALGTGGGTIDTNGFDTTLSQGITGAGGLTKAGAGTAILTSASSYAGGTTIAGGILQIGNGGTSGSITGNVANAGTLIFNRSDALTFSGAVSGSGSLLQAGAGTTILTGASGYGGGTSIANGTLQIGNGGTSGSITGNVANAGALIFNRSDALTFSGAVSGSGSLIQAGAGTTILTGASSYAGGTTIAGGTLQIGDGSTSGSISGDVTDNGVLAFDRSDALTFGGTVSGFGSLVQAGPGTTILTASNSYTGGTTIAGGTLQIGNGGTSGSIAGNVTDDGALAFNRSDTVTFSGIISGSGSLAQDGPGTTVLTANNSYTGGTTISSGTLQLATGASLAPTGALTVSGGTFDLNGNSQTVGALSGPGGAVTLGAGTLTAGDASNTELAASISGTGGLVKQGSGTLALSGENAYAGGTTIAGGTLQIGTGGTSGSITGNVADNGTLAFNRSDTVAFSGAVSGSGSLAQAGPGTTILTADNSYTGGTTIANGTLQIGNGGTSGSIGPGDVANNGRLAVSRVDAVTLAGSIAGTGSLVQSGTGTTTLTGNNIYSGTTAISAGALQVGSGGVSGSLGTGDVSNNASLLFNRSNDMTVSNTISGTGSVSQVGTGTTILTGANTYTGGTTIANGTLEIGNGGTSGSIIGDIIDNGSLAFNRSDTVTFSGAISGAGSLIQSGPGTTILTSSNSYTGGTTIANGTLQIGDGGTAGAITGAINNNGTLALNRSDAVTLAGAILGSGSLIQAGPGATILTANNSYTGGTTIAKGTLQLGNGGTSGAITGNVTDNGVLAFNRSDTVTFAGVISGSGALVQTGTGTTNLTANNTYAGGTTITNGRLLINGSVASNVMVERAGTLGGNGVVVGTVTNRGTVSPGNSIGTLNITGTYVQQAGSIYQVEVNSQGQSDKIIVSGTPGTATINGGTVQVVPVSGGYSTGAPYTILSATGGVTGTFSALNASALPFAQPHLSYDANNVYLTLQPGGFAAAAENPVQRAVGAVLDANAANATGDFATVLSSLAANTLSPAQAQATLQALSGNNYAGFSTAMVQGAQLFMNTFASQAGGGSPVSNRIALAEACDVACDATQPALWGAWGSGLGGLGTIGANAPFGTVTYNVGGFAAGLDRLVAPNFRVGVTAGYTTGTQWVGGFDGLGRSDTFQFGLYGGYSEGPIYVDGVVGYAYSYNQMWRQIFIPGLQQRTAQGHTGANQFYGQIETGYRFDLGTSANAFVRPFVRLQAYTGTQNAFTETGAQSLNLTVAAQTTNSLRSVIGAQLGGAIDLGWREKLAVHLRLGWSHEYADTGRPVSAILAGAPAMPFTTYGVAPQRDGVVLGLGANTAVAEGTSIFLRYEGDISGQDSAHAITAGVRMTW